MLVELHILQNFAPSNLNRDDTGQPKACDFGGFRRARISSQCLKRAIREQFKTAESSADASLAKRTKRLELAVADRTRRKPEEVAPIVQAALRGLGIKLDKTTKQPSYLLFLGPAEIERFVGVCRDHWDELADAAKSAPVDEDAESPEPDGASTRRARRTSPGKKNQVKLSSQVEQALDAILDDRASAHPAVDLSLFGRMLADLPIKNVDAAAQVAHAISTNQVDVEFDFYTAVDDLIPRDSTGASMLGTIEFNSACFYRYANLDVNQLTRNLGAGDALADRTVEAFVRASVAAVPTGKQNSMAAHNPPSFVFAVVRQSGLWNLANAFTQPVRPNGGRDLVAGSIDALSAHWRALVKMYGFGGGRGGQQRDQSPGPRGPDGLVGGWAVALDGKPTLDRVTTVESFEEVVAGVRGALAAAGAETEA